MKQKQSVKHRISFVLRPEAEVDHSKSINSIALGRASTSQINDVSAQCRQLFTAGRDGKIRMHQAAYQDVSPQEVNIQTAP